MASLVYGLGHSLQRAVQPLVVMGDDVLSTTRGVGHVVGVLRTASGVEHLLRRLCATRVLVEHHLRVNRQPARGLIEERVRGPAAVRTGKPLAYFVLELLPAVERADWPTWSGDDLQEVDWAGPELASAMDESAARLPPPEIPSPSLWVFGRVWRLVPCAVAAARVSVVLGTRTLVPEGRPEAVSSLAQEWLREAERYVAERASALAARAAEGTEVTVTRLREAEARLAADGFLQFRDLLFVEGQPALVGCVLAPHYNESLGRETNRDVAVAVELGTLPPGVGRLVALERCGSGRWERAALPRGICPGRNQPKAIPDSPALTLVNYLRWAARNIATSNRFQEFD